MLVLARQLNERIVLPTVRATIEVVALRPTSVRLGIDAPPEVTILREEVLCRGDGTPADWPAAGEPDAEARLTRVRRALGNRLESLGLGMRLVRQQLPGAEAGLASMLARMEDELFSLDQQLRTMLDRSPRNDRVNPSLAATVDGGLAI